MTATDEQRTVVKRNSYAPYGEAYAPTSIDGTGYTGHVMDQATGLTYMQQRYYDPQIGRFLSIDSVSADSNTGSNFNSYWYGDNNPYTFFDPDGRDTARVHEGDSAAQRAAALAERARREAEGRVSGGASLASDDTEEAAEYRTMNRNMIADGANDLNEAGKYFGWEALKMAVGGLIGKAATIVRIGKNENQIYHAFRKLDSAGIDRKLAEKAILGDVKINATRISSAAFNQVVTVGGKKIRYTAFRLPDGTINVGRIDVVK